MRHSFWRHLAHQLGLCRHRYPRAWEYPPYTTPQPNLGIIPLPGDEKEKS